MTEDNNENGYKTIEFGNECDLHHLHPRDLPIVVEEFIRQALEHGYESVRIVHGKGTSVAKYRLLKILENHPHVAHFHDDGANWGATIVLLKYHHR